MIIVCHPYNDSTYINQTSNYISIHPTLIQGYYQNNVFASVSEVTFNHQKNMKYCFIRLRGYNKELNFTPSLSLALYQAMYWGVIKPFIIK